VGEGRRGNGIEAASRLEKCNVFRSQVAQQTLYFDFSSLLSLSSHLYALIGKYLCIVYITSSLKRVSGRV